MEKKRKERGGEPKEAGLPMTLSDSMHGLKGNNGVVHYVNSCTFVFE